MSETWVRRWASGVDVWPSGGRFLWSDAGCDEATVEDTVEERLLAFRRRQHEFGGGDGDGDGDDAGEKADGLSVIHEGGADDIGAAVSRAQLQRMRFVFGIADADAEQP